MSFETLDPAGARRRVDEDGWTLLDVRTPEEFSQGSPAGAFNVPFALHDPARGMVPNPEFVAAVQRHFPVEARLVVSCAMGGRSARACELLAAAGYAALVNMDGGFSGRRDPGGALLQPGWQERGFPCEAPPPTERTWAHLRRGGT